MSLTNVFREMRPAVLGLACLALAVTVSDVSASPSCKKVGGQFTLQTLAGSDCTSPVGICAAGQYRGDVNGTSRFIASALIPTADTPTTSVVILTGDNAITTAQGILMTKDVIALSTTGAGNFAELDTVVAGTGRLTGATGQLQATGTFTGAGGEGKYSGQICVP